LQKYLNMIIKTAEFVKSSQFVKDCPAKPLPEYAFIGRSNVGKSSLINMLTGQNKLAKTSSTPGKTQTINHFIINDEWYLVDLPGYGYAKIGKKNREVWHQNTLDYAIKRENLCCFLVLIDIRLEPQKSDLEFMQFLGENGIPFVMVFTKADKITKLKIDSAVKAYAEKMVEVWESLPDMYVTSAEAGLGKEEVLDFIETTNKNLKNEF